MKKNKLKNLLKCGILLFGISTLLFNCQKQDDNLNTDGFQTETYKTVSLNQVSKLKPVIENLKKVRPVLSDNSFRTSETFLGVDNVITNEIIQITDNENVSTYTLSIDTDFENSGYIENLHIIEAEQDYIAYIMRYEPNDTWFTDTNNYTPEGDLVLNLQTFQGHKTKFTIDREIIWSTIPPENARGTWIEVCTISLIEYCSNTYTDNPNGDPHVSGPNCNGPFNTVSEETCTTVYASGGVGNNDNSNNDNPDGNGDNGTTNGGGYAYNDNCEEVTGTLIQDSQPISGMTIGCTTNEDTAVSQPLGKKTPCQKIATQIANPLFDAKVDIVNSSTAFNASEETGFSQKTDGTFNTLSPFNNGHSLSIPITSTMVGFIHSHINGYEIPDNNGDGIPDEATPIKMPSPGDIITFLQLLENANTNNIPLIDIYGTMYSSASNYTLKFTGDIADVLSNLNNLETLRNNQTLNKKYIKYFKDFGDKEKALLHFLKNEIGINGIRLFKIKNNGTIKEKSLKPNGNVESETC